MPMSIRQAENLIKYKATPGRPRQTDGGEIVVRQLVAGAGEEVIPGKPGCAHRLKYCGRSSIETHKPAFFGAHPHARLGFDWEICAEPDCPFARCVCTDPEIAAITEPPYIHDGREWYTIKQALYRMGKPQDAGNANYLARLVRTGTLEGRRMRVAAIGYRGGHVQWVISAKSLEEYMEALEEREDYGGKAA